MAENAASNENNIDDFLSEGNFEKDTSELDSFFEDLTSLDEIDAKNSSEDSGVGLPPVAPLQSFGVSEEPEKSSSQRKAAPVKMSSSGKSKKKYLFALLILLLIGFLGYEAYEFILKDPILSDEDFSPITQIPDFNQQPGTIKILDNTKPQTLSGDDDENNADPNGQFGVQVAVCMFQSCVNEFSYQLRQSNYPVKSYDYSVRGNYIEMITEGSYQRSEAEALALRINKINNIMGNAVVVKASGGLFKVSLGNFFWMEDFKRIKNLIENTIANSDFRLVDNPKRDRASTYRIVAGPFKNKQAAEEANDDIKKIIGFNQAYVVDVTRF